jgi:hypothetical protein
MSAYAIPGFLFPPLPSSSFDTSITANNMMSKDTSGSMVGHSTLTTPKPPPPPPMIKITIQNTKIDAWRLIQSYLTYSSSNNNENLLPHSTGTPPTPSSSCLYNTTPPASMPASYRWRRPTTATDHSSSSFCIDDDDSRVMVFAFHIVIPKEEVPVQHTSTTPPQAYTITRTLQQIRQLQHDLIMEQHEHERSQSDAGYMDELYTIPELPYILDHHPMHAPPHHPSSRTTTPESGGDHDHPPVMLPSFTYLQDKLRLYVPMVENWLYRIAQQQQQQQNTMLWSSSSTTVWMKFLQKSSGDVDDDDATLQREWQPPPYGTASPSNHSSTTTTTRMEPTAVEGRIQYCGNVQQEDHKEPFLSSFSPMVHNNNNNKHGRPPRGGGGGRTTRHPFVKTTRRVVSMESIDEEDHRCKTNNEEDDDGMDL